ncbi:unnamed protein product [Mytilus edulis]|uniref:Fucolectin tachylectin-4 pentraxin-1 domain-containing protein n=1 Tax=Mytilus edulis TaxID=6550 RepID=A0A8S3TSM7_MYTED|nr:unnamed protein product [Mytilus edulis]
MPMWSVCAQFCSRLQLCKSINFITSNKSCQIFDAEPGESNYHGKLIESTGNSFVAASTFPEELAGPCKGHGCKLTEVCIPQSPTYTCIPVFVQSFEKSQQIPLTEVAYGKSCKQSSTAGVEYASKAVDGDLNTYGHTNQDHSPYWIVDLGKFYQVKQIEIFNRNRGSIDAGRRLHDLDIMAGTSLNNLHLCTHYAGPAELGEHIVLGCQYEEKARYVKLTIRGTEYLHVAEVKVYALYDLSG